MITSARYPLTGHVLYLKTIAGTDVVTITGWERAKFLWYWMTRDPMRHLLPEKK